MSELILTSCDSCGAVAPEHHNSLFPACGWVSIRLGATLLDQDFCSVDCLAEWAVLRASDTSAVKPRPKGARKPKGGTATI